MDRFLQTYFPKSTKEKTKLEEEDNYLQTNAQNSVPRYKRGEEIPLSASHSMRMWDIAVLWVITYDTDVTPNDLQDLQK